MPTLIARLLTDDVYPTRASIAAYKSAHGSTASAVAAWVKLNKRCPRRRCGNTTGSAPIRVLQALLRQVVSLALAKLAHGGIVMPLLRVIALRQ